jgi:hypothetical protein
VIGANPKSHAGDFGVSATQPGCANLGTSNSPHGYTAPGMPTDKAVADAFKVRRTSDLLAATSIAYPRHSVRRSCMLGTAPADSPGRTPVGLRDNPETFGLLVRTPPNRTVALDCIR